jgi:hypothetical protein
MTTISDMTLDELKKLINETIDERLAILNDVFELDDGDDDDPRTLEEVFASIDRNLWTPPPGTPSTTQLLREDRER